MDWSWRNIERRVGRFRIGASLLRQEPASIAAVLSKMIVVRCEHLFAEGTFEYEAMSPLFGEVEPGFIIPHYDIWLEHDDKRKGEAEIEKGSIIRIFLPERVIRVCEEVA